MQANLNKTMNDDSTSIEDLAPATVWTPEQQIRELKQRSMPPVAEGCIFFTPRPTDVIVAVPPKCGTTWLLHIVHQLRMNGSEPDFEDQLEVTAWVERSQMFGVDLSTKTQPAELRVFFSHLPYHRIPKEGKIIYCVRDQEDALYSFYKFLDSLYVLRGQVSLPIFANTIMKSGRYDHGDTAMVLNGLLVWWEHRNDDDVLFLFFDDLREDHAGCVRRIAKFIGIECDEALLARVVHTTTHAEMVRHHSKFDTRNSSIMLAKKFGEEPPTEFSGRVRKDGGKSGDGQNLPPEVRQYIKKNGKKSLQQNLDFKIYRKCGRHGTRNRKRKSNLYDACVLTCQQSM